MSVSSSGLMYLNFRLLLSIYLACIRLIAIIKLAAACCDGKQSRNQPSRIITMQSLYARQTTQTWGEPNLPQSIPKNRRYRSKKLREIALRIEKSNASKTLLSISFNVAFVIFTRSRLSRSLHILSKLGVLGSSSFAAIRRQLTASDPKQVTLLSSFSFVR